MRRETARWDLTGTSLLTRLAWRRERRFIVITFVLFVAINLATAAAIKSSYSTPQQIAALRLGTGSNAAFTFLLGALPTTTNQASLTVWRAGLFMVAALAVCAAIIAVRQTRKEEEIGRVELVRAGAIGAHAPLAAAAVIAVGFSVLVALGMSVMLLPMDAGFFDAAAVFAQYAATAMAAAAVGLVTAQIAKTSHIANLAASCVVLAGYLIRGAGDALNGWHWLRWLSPMGWAELVNPFDVNNFWPAVASLTLFVVGVAAAGQLSSHRDLGGGLIEPRPGPASSSGYPTIDVLTAKLSLPVLFSWAGGIASYSFFVGCLQPAVGDLAKDNKQVADFLRNTGTAGSIGAVFAVTMMGILASIATAWAATVVSRLHADETSGRVEAQLATAVSRGRFYLAQVAVTMAGVVVVVLTAAVAIVVGNLVAGGDVGATAHDVFVSGAAQLAACAVVAGAIAGCFGLSSRLAQAGWGIVVVAVILGPMGALFDLPQSIRDISPFAHVAPVPLEAMDWASFSVMIVVAAVLVVLGWWGFRRRDIG